MAFMQVKKDKDSVSDYTPSNFINTSGMYEVKIKYALVDVTKNGATYVNLVVDYEGQEQTIYQAYLVTTKEGKQNEFGIKALNKLAIVTGINKDELDDPEEITIPLGKDSKPTQVNSLEEFRDTEALLYIKYEYSRYNGNIQERRNIRNCYRLEDKATADELVNNVENIGKQYNYDVQSSTVNTYKEDVTAEEVKEFLDSRRSKNKTEKDVRPEGGFTKAKGRFED